MTNAAKAKRLKKDVQKFISCHKLSGDVAVIFVTIHRNEETGNVLSNISSTISADATNIVIQTLAQENVLPEQAPINDPTIQDSDSGGEPWHG